MINNGTIYLDQVGLGRMLESQKDDKQRVPILKVAVLPGRDSMQEDLTFNWNVTQEGVRLLDI
jgi:hypothetical protein